MASMTIWKYSFDSGNPRFGNPKLKLIWPFCFKNDKPVNSLLFATKIIHFHNEIVKFMLYDNLIE